MSYDLDYLETVPDLRLLATTSCISRPREASGRDFSDPVDVAMAGLAPGGGGAMDEAQMKLMQDLEVEVMADLFNRMTAVCHRKCVPTRYRDSELSKGESVCLDRCVAKYLDVHERIGQKLTNISQAEQENLKAMQMQAPPS